jgi:transposase
MVHWSETCDADKPHLITHTKTTAAHIHEANCTASIHQGLAIKKLPPNEHLVDTAYLSVEQLVESQTDHAITLVGPPHCNSSWQSREGGYDAEQFTLDWEAKQAVCPQGHRAASWTERRNAKGKSRAFILFSQEDCLPCSARMLCTRAKSHGRLLQLPPREEYDALKAARQRIDSKEGKNLYNKRAGIEGTLSQGVRAYGLRQSRYRGLAKTHLQHIATAAAINLDRIVDWFNGKTPESERISQFAALAVAAS